MAQYSQIDSIGVGGDKKGLVLRGWLIELGIFIVSVACFYTNGPSELTNRIRKPAS